MSTRRNLLMAGLCAAAAGGAYYLTPRRNVSLVGASDLNDVVPTTFGRWVSRDISDPVALNSEESLAARLYSQLITRLYAHQDTGAEIVMLLAYGEKQTDDLQLHRPEVCYPAFGFKLVQNQSIQLPVSDGVTIPVRRIAAEAPQRRENIIYWSRVGESLPQNGRQQREDRLKTAMEGIIPDGVLSRFSANALAPGGSWEDIQTFVAALVTAMAPDKRKMLIGTARAQSLQGLAARL